MAPGHDWPYLRKRGYWLARQVLRDSATRLGLVTLEQTAAELVSAVETPGRKVVETPEVAGSRR
jgi:hypothetical protein